MMKTAKIVLCCLLVNLINDACLIIGIINFNTFENGKENKSYHY